MRQRWQEEEWTWRREPGHWTYKGRVWGWGGCCNYDCDRVQSKDGGRVLGSPSLENLEAGIFFQKMDKG